MDNGLVLMHEQGASSNAIVVLILVVVDNGLVLFMLVSGLLKRLEVLILVVVDNGLVLSTNLLFSKDSLS